MATAEVTKTYTREEVLNIISSFKATTSDYLIQTYFTIHKITQGPLHSRYQRRFNNIIFNNSTRITERLTLTVFSEKTLQILRRVLNSLKYVSCIHPHKVKGVSCPVLIQYFDRKQGIEHRILDFTLMPSTLGAILTQYDVIEKLVGYCGDFCYKDPAVTNSTSDHVATLRVLSGSNVRDLPYSDGFVRMLFNVLLDYLPEDVTKSLTQLGETVMGMSGNSQFAQDLVTKYREWLECDQHILLSDFTKFVIEHFNAINCYLEPFQCLPYSVGTLFSNVLQRFTLVFMKEIYRKIDRIKFTDNYCAVVYYFYLVQIRDLFNSYEENHYIPPKAWTYFNKEIDYLIENKQVHPVEDESKIDALFKKITMIVDLCYTRAVKYIEPLLTQFENFNNFAWILLNDGPIIPEQVHQTYHVIKNATCETCDDLLKEVKCLNSVIPKIPLLEVESVVGKWLILLKNQEVPMILELLEFLFSLPATCGIIKEEGGSNFECAALKIRENLKRVRGEEIVDNVKEFFGRYFDEAAEIVLRNKIPLFED